MVKLDMEAHFNPIKNSEEISGGHFCLHFLQILRSPGHWKCLIVCCGWVGWEGLEGNNVVNPTCVDLSLDWLGCDINLSLPPKVIMDGGGGGSGGAL